MSVEWLPEFFAGENRIDLNKVMTGGYEKVYQDMMNPLISSALKQSWPIILPFSDGLLRFYAASKNERMLLELRSVLRANLGSSDTNAELPIIREANNSCEKVLLNYAPSGLIRITLLDKVRNDLEAKKRVFAALNRVLSLFKQRPSLREHIRRPVGRVLREFYTACQVDDGKMANKLYQELRASGKLSQRNLLFLHLQTLKAGKKWEAILCHKQLESCLKGRIPLQVVRLLLQALANKIQYLLSDGFSNANLEMVRQECQILKPIFDKPPLFLELQDVTEEWQAWSVGAALNGFTDIETHAPKDIESSWFSELFEWVGMDRKVQDTAQDVGQLQEGDELLDMQRVKELLQYTLLAPVDETIEIIGKLSYMPRNVAEQLKEIPILHQHWVNLQANYLQQDYGWTKWFSDLCGKEEQTDELRQLAMSDCMEWSNITFEPELIMKSFDIVGNGKEGEALRDVLPLMLEWLHGRDIKCPDLFWVKLLELMALDDYASQQDVQLSGAVLERLFTCSYSKASYEDAIQALEILLDKVNSVQSYDAVLELIDLLLDNPCPSPKSQRSLWLAIQRFAFKKWHRLNQLLRRLTLFFSREILGPGTETAFPDVVIQKSNDEDAEEQYPNLSGKALAIYSLTESAAIRAKQMLESLFDGLIIYLNHDHVATSALKNLAEKTEYFVFASKSAKHQAFYAVTNIRNDIIYPQGKGASSIVREFVSQVRRSGV